MPRTTSTIENPLNSVLGENLTEEDVSNYCKDNLAAYKVPKIIEFIDELPKSAVGKILRRKLKDMEIAKIAKQKKASS